MKVNLHLWRRTQNVGMGIVPWDTKDVEIIVLGVGREMRDKLQDFSKSFAQRLFCHYSIFSMSLSIISLLDDTTLQSWSVSFQKKKENLFSNFLVIIFHITYLKLYNQ